MAATPADSPRSRYLEATAHMNAERWEERITVAKRNLLDWTLSRHWQMKNLFLIADGTDDWYEAERCRGEIGHLWNVEGRRIDPDDYEARKTLSDLRTSLDQLKEDQERQRPEDFDVDLLYPEAVDEEDDEDGELMIKSTEAVHGSEVKLYGGIDPIARQFEVTSEESAQGRLAREARKAWKAGKGIVAAGEEGQQNPSAATVSTSKPAEGLP